MKKLALLDLDGTLFDTTLVNYYAYNQALNEQGYEINKEYYCNECNGRDYHYFIPKIVNNDDKIVEKVHDRKKELYSQFLKEARINTHLFTFLESIKNDYYLAICTTASKKNTYQILEYFKKKDLFDLIVTQDDVKKAKPDPEIFNYAISYFKAKPEDTIIFEDSEVGIEAAQKTKANIFVVKKF